MNSISPVPASVGWSMPVAVAVFLAAVLLIVLTGSRLAFLADELADRTGIGEALMGAMLLGATTSLPGITASVNAALSGSAQLSLSNAYGGIAVQTLFLAIADISYRRANLEHAAASLENLMMGAALIVLLGIIGMASMGPEWTFLGVHPVTPVLFLAYLFFMNKVNEVKKQPPWSPMITEDTREDIPQEKHLVNDSPVPVRVVLALVLASLMIVAGVAATNASMAIALHTGINQSVIGALMLAVATSIPELVTSISAVRSGALTLAVGGILGGNAFDTLFAAAGDLAYREGSIYHGAGESEFLLLSTTVVMCGILLLGLIRRERQGPGGIGFESVLVIITYTAGILLLTRS